MAIHIMPKVSIKEGESFHQCLGISDERLIKLSEAMELIEKDPEFDTHPKAISKISEMTETIEELAVCCFIMGAYSENQRRLGHKINAILDLISTSRELDGNNNAKP